MSSASIKPLPRLVIVSRESALAMWQARHVQQLLVQAYPQTHITIRGMTTQGDRILDRALDKVGGKGLFVKELEDALSQGTADLAVHSIKDVPMVLPDGFQIPAIMKRDDPRDAFVSNHHASLAALPPGSVIGTSSLRRESQIRALFPQLVVQTLRGNVPTRLKKLDDGNYSAIVLAAAGLNRLGLAHRITAILTPEQCLPAPGQGAMGIECLSARHDVAQMIGILDDPATACCVRAERALSRALSGNCQVPLGSYGQIAGDRLTLRGYVGSKDGVQQVRAQLAASCQDPEALGTALAARLKELGAGRILEALES